MDCSKSALTMLILGSVMILGTDAGAQAAAPGPARLARCPAPPPGGHLSRPAWRRHAGRAGPYLECGDPDHGAPTGLGP